MTEDEQLDLIDKALAKELTNREQVEFTELLKADAGFKERFLFEMALYDSFPVGESVLAEVQDASISRGTVLTPQVNPLPTSIPPQTPYYPAFFESLLYVIPGLRPRMEGGINKDADLKRFATRGRRNLLMLLIGISLLVLLFAWLSGSLN